MKWDKARRHRLLLVFAVIAVAVMAALLIAETFRLLLPGLWTAFTSGDGQAMGDYLNSEGRVRSFLTLWFLSFVQVVSIVIPSLPVQLAAGIAYGPWMGFVSCFSASVLANMAVFLLGRRLAAVITELMAGNARATRMLNSVRNSRDPWFYTMLAFLFPGLPNGVIPYAAANAGMRPRDFFGAVMVSRPLPTLLTCAAGYFLLAGLWWVSVLLFAVMYAGVGVLFWQRKRFLAWARRKKDRRP